MVDVRDKKRIFVVLYIYYFGIFSLGNISSVFFMKNYFVYCNLEVLDTSCVLILLSGLDGTQNFVGTCSKQPSIQFQPPPPST